MRILIWEEAPGLGDGIMSTGVPKKIKEIYPDAIIDIISTKTFSAPYIYNKYINKRYFFNTYSTFWKNVPQKKVIKNYLFQLSKIKEIIKNKYDIILDGSSTYSSASFKFFKMVRKEFDTKIYGYFKEKNIYGYTLKFLSKKYTKINTGGSAYELINIPDDVPYDIKMPSSLQQNIKAHEYFQSFRTKYGNDIKIVIFNGEGSGKKNISKEKIIATIKALLNSSCKIYIFFMGYKPCLSKYKNIVKVILSDRVNITYETEFYDVCALIKYADLLISIDTSIIHAASAFDTKVVEIYSQNMKGYKPCFPKYIEYKTVKQSENLNKFDIDGFDEKEICEKTMELLYPNLKNTK